MLIFLIGFMGSGKTTIGREIARALDCDFWDMDELIQDQELMRIPEIFELHGQAHFRKLEREMIKSLPFTMDGDVVLATGGGAPCFFDNIEQMNKQGTTVYLEMAPDDLFYRLKKEASFRPLLANKGEDEMLEFIRELHTERSPFYQKATYSVDGNRSPEIIVEHILYLLNE